jgi:hypothetical protein
MESGLHYALILIERVNIGVIFNPGKRYLIKAETHIIAMVDICHFFNSIQLLFFEIKKIIS